MADIRGPTTGEPTDDPLRRQKERELHELLGMFLTAGVVDRTGGIKDQTNFERVINMFRRYSSKMTVRNIYVLMLMRTDKEVLKRFLHHNNGDGWEIIKMWLQRTQEIQEDQTSRAALINHLHLLEQLPVDMELLQNPNVSTPKIVRQLTKSENPMVSKLASEIKEKWTQVIQSASGVMPSTSGEVKDPKKKKKRHSTDSGQPISEATPKKILKKDKIPNKNVEKSPKVDGSDDNSVQSVIEEIKIERTPRPSTAKVKPGKSRLGDLIASQTKSAKKRKESPSAALGSDPNKDKDKDKDKDKEKDKDKDKETPAEDKGQLTPANPIVQSTPVVPQKPHILTESGFFMDALTAEASAGPKKKRRSSHTVTPQAPTSPERKDDQSSQPADASPDSAPSLSFYKDMSDERFNAESTQDDSQSDISQTSDEKSNGSVGSYRPMDFAPSSPAGDVPRVIADPVPSHIKPILSYGKKAAKKSVRWPETVVRIKYFELDETERVNVTRPPGSGSFSDLRRHEMRGEKERMTLHHMRHNIDSLPSSSSYSAFGSSFSNSLSMPGQSSGESYGPYVLYLIEGADKYRLVESGKDSQERHIQEDRQRGSLPVSYPPGFAPPFPTEPDPEPRNTFYRPVDIPLDDKDGVKDFSNDSFPTPFPDSLMPFRTQPGPEVPLSGLGPHVTARPPDMVTEISQNLVRDWVGPMDGLVPINRSTELYQPPIPPQIPQQPPQHMPRAPGQRQFRPFSPGPSGQSRGDDRIRRGVCRFFARDGKCRRKPCNFQHIRGGPDDRQRSPSDKDVKKSSFNRGYV